MVSSAMPSSQSGVVMVQDFDTTQGATDSVRAVVKWFDAKKGFGFVSPPDSSTDAFLHVTVLERAGLKSLLPGATVVCVLGRGDKGMQVSEILDIDTSTADLPEPGVDGDETMAEVKFFRSDKGYGFAVADNLDKDVFIGASTLQKSGISTLTPGQRIRLMYEMGERGPLGTFIRLADGD